MKTANILTILKAQATFHRTMIGRFVTEDAVFASQNTIDDQNNLSQQAMICKNCKYVNSDLQFPSGCPNCGGHDIINYGE